MSGPSLRDRLLTRHGARALLSPVGLLGGVAVAVVLGVAGLPAWAAAVVGVATWGANAWRLLPRRVRPDRIDPFTLHDPWRRFVQSAQRSRNALHDTLRAAHDGPLKDRLTDVARAVTVRELQAERLLDRSPPGRQTDSAVESPNRFW